MRSGHGSMWTKNKIKGKRDDRGSTMVTVIVSFALLLIFVTAFYKVQKTSQSMMMAAKDMTVESRELIKAFYLEETENQVAAEAATLTFQGEEGSFTIETTIYRAQKEGLPGTIYYYDAQAEE